jgi:serine/threonine-protein kinase 24/25/MST4
MNIKLPTPPSPNSFDTATKLTNGDRYKLKLQLAQNNNSFTFKASDQINNCDVIIKILNIENKTIGIEELQSEIVFLSNTSHCKQLTKYQESFILESKLWIVMEYLNSGNIYNMIQDNGPLIESNIAYIMREMLLGLQYLHSQKIIHRNIKSSNILCSSNGDIKLTDFGEASIIFTKNNSLGSSVKSPFWLSPEVITESSYSTSSDVWSLGITAFELATSCPPYYNNKKITPMQVIYSIPNVISLIYLIYIYIYINIYIILY